jgi:predicted oxidoreductase
MMTNEEWYDAEIAPALAELAKRCHERGMAFVAAVEYEPGERGGTYYMTEGAGLEMRMLHICAQTVPNVDAYVLNLKRFTEREGIDTSASWVLTH